MVRKNRPKRRAIKKRCEGCSSSKKWPISSASAHSQGEALRKEFSASTDFKRMADEMDCELSRPKNIQPRLLLPGYGLLHRSRYVRAKYFRREREVGKSNSARQSTENILVGRSRNNRKNRSCRSRITMSGAGNGEEEMKTTLPSKQRVFWAQAKANVKLLQRVRMVSSEAVHRVMRTKEGSGNALKGSQGVELKP